MAYKFQVGTSNISGAVNVLDSFALSGSGEATFAGNLKVGDGGAYYLTSGGALNIASMAGDWTNSGITVADLGTVTAATSITATDLVGTNIDGIVGAGTARAGTFTTLQANTVITGAAYIDVAGGISGSGVTTMGGDGFGFTNVDDSAQKGFFIENTDESMVWYATSDGNVSGSGVLNNSGNILGGGIVRLGNTEDDYITIARTLGGGASGMVVSQSAAHLQVTPSRFRMRNDGQTQFDVTTTNVIMSGSDLSLNINSSNADGQSALVRGGILVGHEGGGVYTTQLASNGNISGSGQLEIGSNGSFNGNVNAQGNVNATAGNLSASAHVFAAGNMEADGNVVSRGNVSSSAHVFAAGNMEADGNVVSRGNVSSSQDVYAARNIEADGNITTGGGTYGLNSGGTLTATSWTGSAGSDLNIGIAGGQSLVVNMGATGDTQGVLFMAESGNDYFKMDTTNQNIVIGGGAANVTLIAAGQGGFVSSGSARIEAAGSGALVVTGDITGSGKISGSFYGDGSNLTGIGSDSITTTTATAAQSFYVPFIDQATGATDETIYIADNLVLNPSTNQVQVSGSFRTTGNATFAGNVSSSGDVELAGNLKVGGSGYYLTSGGALNIASMAGDWTNASRTVANMGIVTTMDLNGGTIDGATLGASSQSTAKFTTLSASGETTLAGHLKVGNGGAYYITSAGALNVAGASVTSLSSSGVAQIAGNLTVGNYGLTNAGAATIASMAANWTNAGRTVADAGILTTADINGGTYDGGVINSSTIGATTPASGKFTTLSASSNVDIAGNLEVDGNMTVRGTTTVISSSNLLIQDRLIGMAFSGSGDAGPLSDRALIMGLTGENSVAMMWDESASTFAFVRTTTDPDSTGGEVAIASYADLRVKSIVGGQQLSVNSFTAAGDLADGYNYAGAALNAAATMQLPGSPSAGDVVYVKGNTNTAVAKAISISGAAGSKATFDGDAQPIQLVSPYGAVNLICVDATSGAEKWSIY